MNDRYRYQPGKGQSEKVDIRLYIMAVTWAAQMLSIAYIIIFDTQRAGYILNAMGSLSAIWAVGLSVLGIYVYKRSEDKKLFPPSETIFWNRH